MIAAVCIISLLGVQMLRTALAPVTDAADHLAIFIVLAVLASSFLPLANQSYLQVAAPRLSSLAVRYGLVLGLVPVGLLMATAFDQVFPGPDFPWVLLAVVCVCAWYGGHGPAAAASILCLAATIYCFLPSMYAELVTSQPVPVHALELLLLSLAFALIVVVLESHARSTTTT